MNIVADLDDARHKSMDPPDQQPLPIIQTVHTGRRGRPSKPIDPTFLRHALALRGPSRVSQVLQCSARHIRRQALRHGIVDPAPPVFRVVHNNDGSFHRVHTTQTAPVSTLTDPQLDAILMDILTAFPRMGHVMLVGALRARGHRVPESRVHATCVRIRGAPPDFARRRIIRKRYKVPGPNSLVHHDGQHGQRSLPYFGSFAHLLPHCRTYTLEVRHPLFC